MNHTRKIEAAAEFVAGNLEAYWAYTPDPSWEEWAVEIASHFDSDRWVQYQPATEPRGAHFRSALATFDAAERAAAIRLGREWFERPTG